jgi:hypothetical protein
LRNISDFGASSIPTRGAIRLYPLLSARRNTLRISRNSLIFLGPAVSGHQYRVEGRVKLLSLGTYPELPLKLARERCDQARQRVTSGGDPSAQRKAERAARSDTFEAIAREWLEVQSKSLDRRTLQKKKERFEAFVFPYLGSKPITKIAVPEFLGDGGLASKRPEPASRSSHCGSCPTRLLRLGHPLQSRQPEIVSTVHERLITPAQARRILSNPGLVHYDMAHAALRL